MPTRRMSCCVGVGKTNAALRTLFVAPGWGCPRLLEGNVNSLAWQDSANISLDGKVISFMESSLDVVAWVARTGGDPAEYGR